ncbi:hypothetical protein [Aureispira anguillae]|uniref:Uncharacterized protein n=1 Tax=Aureispira anguillae TaxID=2864201 RepID=A0A915YB32_9BACT|nr:hypothetical protein [Aureispira anguillae]BDS09793.1 hypothetical protein AsAng_0004980 [Aureispira anguillae]
MKLLTLFFFILISFQVSHAQTTTIKLTDISFKKEYVKAPLVVATPSPSLNQPNVTLPKEPNFIWKYNIGTTHYYNNHPANPLCFNTSNGWELVQVRPIKHQFLYEAAAVTTGVVLEGLLNMLNQ